MAEQGLNICVAVDGSECSRRAVEEAIQLAQAFDAMIHLIHIVDWSDYSFINVIEVEDRTRMRTKEEKNARENILQPLSKLVRDADIKVENTLRFGHPAKTVKKFADEYDSKMVVVGTKGRSDLSNLILGSFSHALVQMADRPILLVP